MEIAQTRMFAQGIIDFGGCRFNQIVSVIYKYLDLIIPCVQ